MDASACQGEDCPCLTDGDCGAGQACEEDTGQCFNLDCLNDRNCALGDVCLSGRCVTDVEADRDRDGVPDNEDRCPELADSDQEDNDQDGRGDACDDDDDGDGLIDEDVKVAVASAEAILKRFRDRYQSEWHRGMKRKLGLLENSAAPLELFTDLTVIFEAQGLDYTSMRTSIF